MRAILLLMLLALVTAGCDRPPMPRTDDSSPESAMERPPMKEMPNAGGNAQEPAAGEDR